MHLRHSLRLIAIAIATASLASLTAVGQSAPLGPFEGHGDIGAPKIAGSAVGIGTAPGFGDVCLGILIILLPVLVGRVVGLGGWPLSPIVFLLVSTGLGIEFLAWSSGFGAVLTNVFSRWQATRAARAVPRTPAAP